MGLALHGRVSVAGLSRKKARENNLPGEYEKDKCAKRGLRGSDVSNVVPNIVRRKMGLVRKKKMR